MIEFLFITSVQFCTLDLQYLHSLHWLCFPMRNIFATQMWDPQIMSLAFTILIVCTVHYVWTFSESIHFAHGVVLYTLCTHLTHWGRVTHICVVELDHHWLRQWLVACSAPSHYLNTCWNIVNWTCRNKLQWNFYQNSNIFIQEIAFENVVCKIASILSRPQWVNMTYKGLKTATIDDENGLVPIFV